MQVVLLELSAALQSLSNEDLSPFLTGGVLGVLCFQSPVFLGQGYQLQTEVLVIVVNNIQFTAGCLLHRDWTRLRGLCALNEERAVEAEDVAETRSGPGRDGIRWK